MEMNFVTFNQDYSHLAVGTTKGFKIYITDPFTKCYESKQGDVALLEMLFSTSLVALVLSPRKLEIRNTKREQTICELTFPTTVLAVRMNRKRLAAVLEDQIYLYDISNMKLLYTIETSPNPSAICALSPSSEHCYMVYPLPQKAASSFTPPSHTPPVSAHTAPTSGDVLFFDTIKLESINVVEAHRSPLSIVAVNDAGTLLATASDKGTIIRVFAIPSSRKLYQFRRGSMPSRIYSMAFNSTSTLLCVSSASETVHIFKLSASIQSESSNSDDASFHTPTSQSNRNRSTSPVDSESQAELIRTTSQTSDSIPASQRKHNGTLMGMIRRTSQNVGTTVAASVGAYLPAAVSEMWEPARDFAWLKIPKSSSATSPARIVGSRTPLRSVVAISSNSPQVMVVTNEGHYYLYAIDLEKGGEGTLVNVFEVGTEGERLGASVIDD